MQPLIKLKLKESVCIFKLKLIKIQSIDALIPLTNSYKIQLNLICFDLLVKVQVVFSIPPFRV